MLPLFFVDDEQKNPVLQKRYAHRLHTQTQNKKHTNPLKKEELSIFSCLKRKTKPLILHYKFKFQLIRVRGHKT